MCLKSYFVLIIFAFCILIFNIIIACPESNVVQVSLRGLLGRGNLVLIFAL